MGGDSNDKEEKNWEIKLSNQRVNNDFLMIILGKIMLKYSEKALVNAQKIAKMLKNVHVKSKKRKINVLF